MRRVWLLVSLLTACLLTAPVQASAKGDTLTIGMSAELRTLDPHMTFSGICHIYLRQMYESLVGYNDKGDVVPVLAERWEIQDDGVTYKFFLKKGVKFHNGDTMTADDVVFSLKRATGPEGAAVRGFAMYLDPKGIEKLDDYTVQLRSTMPMPAVFLETLIHPWASVLNKKHIESAGKDWVLNPVSTARFKFVSWAKGDRVTLARFDEYHGEKAKLKTMVLRVLVENSVRTIELESGGIDLALEPPVVDVKRLQNNPKTKVIITPGQRQYFLGFDINKAPYNDPRVREAINIAIDREGIVKAVFRDYALDGRGAVPKIVSFNKFDETPPIKRDVERAKQLLKEAGYPKGFENCAILTSDRTEYQRLATVLQENLRSIGLDLPIKIYEWGTYISSIMPTPGREMIIHNWAGTPTSPDPFFFLNRTWHSTSGASNLCFLKDPEMDSLLDKGASLPNGPERTAVYGAVWDRINLLKPAVYLATPHAIFAAVKELEGIRYTSSLINYFGDAYFKEQ